MGNPRPLVIAARHSALARVQALEVGIALERIDPTLQVAYAFRASLGDRNLHDPLWKMPEQGVFTEDFVHDLRSGQADVVVHSWKDLPLAPREGISVVTTLPRADPRDLLLVRCDRMASLQETRVLTVLTSSPRRAYNLAPFLRTALPVPLEDIRFEPVRGNITTRMHKLLNSQADALVLAKAAVDRLLSADEALFADAQQEVRSCLTACRWMVLPLRANPAAAAQGALALEVSDSNVRARDLLAPLGCATTYRAVQRERSVLKAYGGGCHQKIGVTMLPRPYGDVLSLRGLTEAGEVLDTWTLEQAQRFPKTDPAYLWPLQAGETPWFTRCPLDATAALDSLGPSTGLWIARAEALPMEWSPSNRQIVWTAGLETWKKLAHRGIWVHGSAEGLGEQEVRHLTPLLASEPSWVKLSHTEGVEADIRTLATYQLIPREEAPPALHGKTHFFWSSGSAFFHAISRFPSVREGYHACGPGNTYTQLRGHLPSDRLAIYLSHAAWLQAVIP